MPRKQSKAVPEGNDSVSHHDEFGSDDEPTMADIYQLFEGSFDRLTSHFDRMTSHLS